MTDENDRVFNIDTPLGARVKVGRSSAHLGEGVALQVTMQDPEDPRWAEVFLSQENLKDLALALDYFHKTGFIG
jgi:hypothetical protein